MADYISKHDAYTTLKDLESAYIYPPVKEAYAKAARRIDEIKVADVQPVKHGRWIDIYEWAKMHDSIPSGMCLYYWCSECQEEQEKKSNFCPHCGARMDGDTVLHDRCSNYMDCDGSCFIDDTPCDCGGNIEKCKGR